MVFDELEQGNYYIFQPQPVKVQHANCRPMIAHVADLVRYLGDNDEGWHVFEKRNGECIALSSKASLFLSTQPPLQQCRY